VWQALSLELAPLGVEVVSIALDLGGEAAVRPWIEAAQPTHPSLIDQAHVTDELLGFVNVPMAVWIDEDGMLVQPAHVAQVTLGAGADRDKPLPEGLPDDLRKLLETVRRIPRTADQYVPALKDWAANGAESRFALSPDEVIARSRPRPPEHAEAAAAFELGQHLHRTVGNEAAVPWFRRAHELDPGNWTYKRQAWTLATTQEGQPSDLLQAPTELYEGSWYADVSAAGPETYYPPLDLERGPRPTP
jgi:hypothetical protein